LNRKIYVGNLPTTFEELDLENLFKNHGNVLSANIFNQPAQDWFGKYGFVEMSSESEAKEAIMKLNSHLIFGRRITVSHIVLR
jgi:RNA recognition motif-containing protein